MGHNTGVRNFVFVFFLFFVFVCLLVLLFFSRFYSGKCHLQVEKRNICYLKSNSICDKVDGNNNDQVKSSVSCNDCNNSGGVKDVLRC